MNKKKTISFNNHVPEVSVVMPVFNAEKYLRKAIASIQAQTFKNWELIIVDDCSNDDSLSICQETAAGDSRIRVYSLDSHSGVAYAANQAISYAKGKYIARMDADDISQLTRLQRQLTFLKLNPELVAVGSQCYLIDRNDQVIGQKNFPTQYQEIKKMMFYYYPLQQPTLMVNTKLLPRDFQWYRSGMQAAEEHELLFKLLEYGQVVNLPDSLLFYRLHERNVTKLNPKKDFFNILKIRLKGIYHYHHLPSIKAIIMTLAQVLVIGLLPQELIFPLYCKLRGLKQQS